MDNVFQNIKLSVIIPLYNKANFIVKTVESVLSQTYSDFEVLIVNDGSTDNSLEIVQELKDDRINVYSKKNGGVSSARNFGIEKARYEYIAFLDADDIWENTFLEEICLLIEKYPEASIFCTNYANKYLNGTLLVNNKQHIPSGIWNDYFKISMSGNCITCSSSCCVKKMAFLVTGCFNETYSMGEDLDMWFRLAEKYKFAYSRKVLATYNRCDQSGLVSSFNDDPDKSWIFNIQLQKYNRDTYPGKYLEKLVAYKIADYTLKHRYDLVRLLCTQNKIGNLDFLRFFYIGMNKKIKRKIFKIIETNNGKNKIWKKNE